MAVLEGECTSAAALVAANVQMSLRDWRIGLFSLLSLQDNGECTSICNRFLETTWALRTPCYLFKKHAHALSHKLHKHMHVLSL